MIGHVVLAALLQRGRPCVCLSRAAEADAIERLAGLLAPFGLDARRLCADGALSAVSCDLSNEDVIDSPTLAGPIAAFIHAAADTRFNEAPDGAVQRTNVTGAYNATRIAESHGARRFIFVSTAYVCGRTPGAIPEHVGWAHESNNDYEESKRCAEQIVAAYGARTGTPVVIARPSIVVGDSESGRASKFTGFYLGVRAAAALARAIPEPERLSIPLRMLGRPADPIDLVPVDYVAGAITHLAVRQTPFEGVLHLTHPGPPSNESVQRAIESYFGIAGGRYVDPDDFRALELTELERQFLQAQGPIRAYLVNPPRFDRANADALDAERGARCPAWTEASLHRLFAFATESRWGRSLIRMRTTSDTPCRLYFEHYLPSVLGSRALPGGESVDASVRFVVRDIPDGAWLCVFVRGRLASVSRTSNGCVADIRYELTEDAFWGIVTGRESPQDVFLRGEAEISGDMERAMMLGVLLRRFNELHPCDRRTLETAV
jgi:nucleoside-diphosphate-sugar epimerase